MSAIDGATSSRELVLDELRGADKLLLATHERPDGDALGSLVGMQLALEHLGKDVLSYVAPEEFPLPGEYTWLELSGLVTEPPADLHERTVVFLDCGNSDRIRAMPLREDGARLLNVDHHHDNTRFGTVDHVVSDASCTAEIVWDLMQGLGVPLDRRIGEALYVGLVTDTGRFMYENTTATAHRMAADLIEAGVDTHAVYRRLFEDLPFSRLELLTRALQRVARYDGGSITMAMLTRSDYEQTGALETDSEGVVDHLRAVEGTKVAVLVRELLADDRRGRRKVSLRATDGKVDVSLIARNLGGGGHRQAAGFTTELTPDELVTVLRELVAAQLSAA